jgi:hypothetical protein
VLRLAKRTLSRFFKTAALPEQISAGQARCRLDDELLRPVFETSCNVGEVTIHLLFTDSQLLRDFFGPIPAIGKQSYHLLPQRQNTGAIHW